MDRLYSRPAALGVAGRARLQGVPLRLALPIAFACRKERLRYALGFAMFEQESEFKVIYGHDVGGLLEGEKVTRANYRRFRAEVVRRGGGGANGVGLGQVTYWTYVRDHAGLWKPRVQVYLAASILAAYIRQLGEFAGVGAYNGGPSNPNEDYADEVLARARRWRPRLAGRRRR